MSGISRAAVLAAYLQVRRRRFADREELLAWQRPRLRRALRRARVRFPFYRDLPGTGLADFPELDRATWLAGFDRLNDRGLTLEQCLAAARQAEDGRQFDTRLRGLSVGLSSGTSGAQGAFLTSPAERARWAGSILAKALPGGLLAGARVALVLRAGGPLYAAVDGGRVSFRFVDLYAGLPAQAAALAAYQPTVLAAPPVLLDLLAAERLAGRLPIAPALVYSIADVLDPDVEARIGAGFGVRVGQVYQATEGFLGITCCHGRLHLNEDLVVVERRDLGEGRFVPVVTDLYRTSQAVIRYRMGDVLVAAGPCACGSPALAVARVEGRADDVLLLRRPDGSTGHCYADLVRSLVLGVPGVADFQLVQQAPDRLVLAADPAGSWPAAAAALRQGLAAAGFTVPAVAEGGFAPPDPTSKRRRVSRAWR